MTEATSTTTEKRSITMSDGTIVAFNKKQKLVKSSIVTDEAVIIRLDFENGETRNFALPESLMDKFAAHGAEQKLGDAIAGETEIGDCVLAIDDLIGRLTAGEWNVGRKAGEFAGTSVLIQALVQASGKTVDQIKAYLSTKSQAEKLALRRSDKVRPFVEAIEAEKAKTSKSTVDTGSLLDELGLGSVEAPKKAKAA